MHTIERNLYDGALEKRRINSGLLQIVAGHGHLTMDMGRLDCNSRRPRVGAGSLVSRGVKTETEEST